MTMFARWEKKRIIIKNTIAVVCTMIIIAGVFLTGVFFGMKKSNATLPARVPEGITEAENNLEQTVDSNVDFRLFNEVWGIAKSQYLEQPVKDKDLFYGSLAGIIASLKDPYSVFFDPETTKKFTEELNGTFTGIGAEIAIKKDQLLIVAPLPDSPAEGAGIRSGDRILAIDKRDTAGMPVEVAVNFIRGASGTQVTLSTFRDGFKAPKDVTITRQEIKIESVTYKMVNQIAYIKIVHFNGDTVPQFGDAVQNISLKNPKGIIIDLRSNPGGYLESAVDVTGEWLPKNSPVVIQRMQGGKQEDVKSERQPRFADIPTVVLINEGTASAAEIMAGALQDYQKARIIGEKSFGKGSVQSFEPLRDGSSIKITIAEWLTPKGRSINKEGIAPDEVVKRTREDFEADRDPQLARAIAILKQKK